MNCNRGYEFWLAKQAKARNPNIRLYGLPWGFPGYLGGANNTPPLAPWNAGATASYIADWVQCAQKNNLTIDFIGPWNELDKPFADYGMGYLKTLRSTLDSRGLQHTKLVGGDVHTWVDPLCDALNSGEDAALKHAVAVIGKHCTRRMSASLVSPNTQVHQVHLLLMVRNAIDHTALGRLCDVDPSTQSTAKAVQTGLPLVRSPTASLVQVDLHLVLYPLAHNCILR